MDGTHIHLLITHLPLFGSMCGAIVMIVAFAKKSEAAKTAAYLVFVVSALGAVTAYLTGDAAEHAVRKIDPSAKDFIHPHENFAFYALISLILLGVFSLVGLYINAKKPQYASKIASVVFILSLVSFGLVGWTAYLGGQVRHTEIRTAPVEPPPAPAPPVTPGNS